MEPSETMKSPFSRLLLILIFLSATGYAHAEAKIPIPSAPKLAASAYILQDFNSGRVLVENHPDEHLDPASLTKIMTVYVAFRELANANLALTDQVTVSKKAWQMGGSRMYIEVDRQVSVEDLLKGIIIQSGNDASVALAEHIAGDEATFAELMNQQAERLGMTHTHYTNSTGWPSPDHYTTAKDLATLTRVLIKEFPDHYAWHAVKEYTYNNITQHNRNKLLWRDSTVDGVKTGHTEAAGYCLVTSAKRNDMRMISVVMGTQSENARANQNQTLLNYGFRFFETHRLYQAQQKLTEIRVWKGETKTLALGLTDDFYVTIPRHHYDDLEATMEIDKQVIAPLDAGAELGALNITLVGEQIASQALVALNAMPEGGIFRKLYDKALMYWNE